MLYNIIMNKIDPVNICNDENYILKKHITESNIKYSKLLKQMSEMKKIFNIQTLLFILLILLLFYIFSNNNNFAFVQS